MAIKKTTFKLTESALQFENLLLEELEIPRTVFHRKMIKYLCENGIEVQPCLKITNHTDPNFVRKDAMEQVYLDEKSRMLVEDAMRINECKAGAVLFQALLSYSIAIAPEVLGKKDMKILFPDEKGGERSKIW